MNADEVSKNLWVGGVPHDHKAVDKKFDALVLCAQEWQDVFPQHLYPDTELILSPIDDAKPSKEEKQKVLKTALRVREILDEGKKVLVTCAAGVNRSSMVAAIAMMLGKDNAKTAVEAIRKLRKPQYSKITPLANDHFVNFINEVWDEISKQRTRTG